MPAREVSRSCENLVLHESRPREGVVLGRYGYELAIDCERPTEYS
jgi:hypothetical protein